VHQEVDLHAAVTRSGRAAGGEKCEHPGRCERAVRASYLHTLTSLSGTSVNRSTLASESFHSPETIVWPRRMCQPIYTRRGIVGRKSPEAAEPAEYVTAPADPAAGRAAGLVRSR